MTTEIFEKCKKLGVSFGIPNICTPEALDVFKKGHYAIELSYGYSWLFKHSYGVTVIDLRTKKNRNDLSRCFIDDCKEIAHREAVDYINNLEY